MKFFLGGYIVRLTKKRSNIGETLSSFGEYKEDFFYVFKDYLNCIRQRSFLAIDNRILAVEKYSVSQSDRRISGIINSGTFGTEAQIVDANSGESTYLKRRPEAELSPFFFLAYFPEGMDYGFIILQRNGQSGIKTNLERDIDAYLNKMFPEFNIELNYMIPADLLKTFLSEDKVKSIRFIKNNAFSTELATHPLDDNEENALKVQYPKGEFSVEVEIKAKRNQFLPVGTLEAYKDIKRYISTGGSIRGVLEMRDKSFEYDNIKIECVLNGNRRTFDLGDLHRAYPHFDVSGHVTLDKNGFPRVEDMQREASQMLNDYVVAAAMANLGHE